jgi:hypothetical protein
MENTVDLFNNPALKQQFDSLPESEKIAYKKSGEYMYNNTNYDAVSSTQSSIDDAVEDLRRAFQSGLMPWHLSEDEVKFLVGVYGDEWYTEFGFETATKPSSEKKTTKLSTEANFHRKNFSLFVLRNSFAKNTEAFKKESNVPNIGIVDTTERDGEDYENRNSGYVYTEWC